MRDSFARVVAHVGTVLTRPDVLAYRGEALQNWMLPGGIEAVQATVLAKVRAALDYARSSNAYYAGLFAFFGFDPLTMMGLEEAGVLAVTTKDSIRWCPDVQTRATCVLLHFGS